VTAAAYSIAHPDVHITWEKRTLRDFAEMSLPELAKRYDMIVLDHPWLGATEAAGSLLPLDDYLDANFLADQAGHSVGKSNESYIYHGRQWALAIDAACQVSAYRPDLLDSDLPHTWDEVFRLANRLKESGYRYVATPLMHVDTFPCFFSLCANVGEPPGTSGDVFVSRAIGRYALDSLRALAEVGHPLATGWNPPQLLDHMTTTDEIVYCPLLFAYSNYARPGYRTHLVKFTNIPSANSVPRGAILGGAGLAISSGTKHPEIACDYAAFVASADVQRGMYFVAGGQPGHRAAWLDDAVNAASSDFFMDTLATLDYAALRPRYHGWIGMQDSACQILHAFLLENGDVERTLDQLDESYRQSLPA
jgi:multiple sugar transport system substrate-binding protein